MKKIVLIQVKVTKVRVRKPFSLLKLQTIVMDPVSSNSQKNDAITQAVNLGLDTCLNCPGCKCGIGIDLKGKVVDPLIKESKKIKNN